MNEIVENLRNMFEYNSDDITRPFVRKIPCGPRNRYVVGTRVGCGAGRPDQYACLRIGRRPGILILMHRAVWMFHNGEIPENIQIDHINCDRRDNRIENLRLATSSMNSQNQIKAIGSNRYSKVLGVGFRPDCTKKPWFARIGTKNGMKKSKQFATIDEAIIAREELAQLWHEGHIIR